MKVSYNWLQTYFDTQLPSVEEVADKLTFHAFEIEGIEKVREDFVIDVDVLPNRAHDCLSHRGIAKELSVILEIPLKEDILRNESKKVGEELPESKVLSVEIENSLLCRRYTSAVIQGVKVGPSPDWLKNNLSSIGQKSINNVVDATNYVMFGLGQPLHAFDASQLHQEDEKFLIKIRCAQEGEKITVLTGEEYTLNKEDLLIVDNNSNNPIGIAGVKGGKEAGIDESTTDIIIESANFNPINTRKTSQSLKLRTDASTRFENEISPELALYGLTEVTKIIQDLAGGNIEGYVDEYPKRATMQYKVGVSVEEINKLLGTKVGEKELENILKRFGFVHEKVKPLDKVLTLAPTFKGVPYTAVGEIRYDNAEKFSCSSFVNYLFVQGGISLPSISIDQYVYGTPIEESDIKPGDIVFFNSKEGKIRYESVDYFTGTKVPEGVDHCALYIGDGKIIHAARGEGKVIEERIEDSSQRNNIVGYRRMTDNKERYVVEIPFERLDLRVKEDLIEEIGRIYGYTNIGEETPKKDKEAFVHKKYYYAEKIRDILTSEGFTEVYTYSLRDKGELELENPFASDKDFVRSTLRDGIEGSLVLNEKNKAVLGITKVNVFEIGNVFVSGKEHTSVCIGMSEHTKESEQTIEDLFMALGCSAVGKWEGKTYEFSLNEILSSLPESKEYDVKSEDKLFSYKPFSLFPSVLRDIAVWTPESVSSDEILSVIANKAGELLVQSSLFDEYKKDGRVSYAFKLVFQSGDMTLSDEEINEIMKKITDHLNSQEGFEVR